MRALTFIFAMFLSCGTSSESAAQLNQQNIGAAEVILAAMTDLSNHSNGQFVGVIATVQRAAIDIAANSHAFARYVVGTPENPVEYSSENSAALREKLAEETSSPWWYTVLNVGLGLVAFVFGNELFQRFLPLIPGTIGKVITKLLTGPYGRAIPGILKSTEALLNKLKDGTITRE